MNPRFVATVVCAAWLAGCTRGPIAPSCDRRTGTVLNAPDVVIMPSAPASFDVISPENSNLSIAVTWADRAVDVKVVATIVECGVHVGCQTGQPIVAASSQSPFRDLRVDGSRGKRYRVDLSSERDVTITLRVTYDTGTCT